jgi:hypothetical protein
LNPFLDLFGVIHIFFFFIRVLILGGASCLLLSEPISTILEVSVDFSVGLFSGFYYVEILEWFGRVLSTRSFLESSLSVRATIWSP